MDGAASESHPGLTVMRRSPFAFLVAGVFAVAALAASDGGRTVTVRPENRDLAHTPPRAAPQNVRKIPKTGPAGAREARAARAN